MKAFALVLLCALVAVQARHTSVARITKTDAEQGDNPWLVHLRVAISTSGLLNSGLGTLISNNYVLTAASTLENSRFIWVRYGVVNVVNPSLVTETSRAASNNGNIALLHVNRNIEFSALIAPAALVADSELPSEANFCSFGENNDAPGETLSCTDVSLVQEDNTLIASDAASRFDVGAGLVVDGGVVAVLTEVEDGSAVFTVISELVPWIREEAGLGDDEGTRVNFVN